MTHWKSIQFAPLNASIKARNMGGEEAIVRWKGGDESGSWIDENKRPFNAFEWSEIVPEPVKVGYTQLNG